MRVPTQAKPEEREIVTAAELVAKSTTKLAPNVVPISSWEDFQSHIERIAGAMPYQWIFRGQQESAWPLAPTIERGRELSTVQQTEGRLLREFRSKAHLYSDKLPAEDDLWAGFQRCRIMAFPRACLTGHIPHTLRFTSQQRQ